ncbi:MAG: hypothetical protein ACK5SX_12410 [Sandaracinobacter sp.]
MGIPLTGGAADPAVQALAVEAQGGDKQAQYELGRWFEDSGDPNGLNKAIKLYRIAATPRGGTRLMYTPGPSGVTTSVISAGLRIEPHKAAEDRLRSIALDKKSVKRYGRLASANQYELPTHANLPISEKLVIGYRRLVYGTLKALDFNIPEEAKVCAFLTPLYEKYFDSKVTQCDASAYLLNESKVVYFLNVTNQIQDARLGDADDPYWIWLEGTTKAPVVGQNCGHFYINSVGTREYYYDILVAPAKKVI